MLQTFIKESTTDQIAEKLTDVMMTTTCIYAEKALLVESLKESLIQTAINNPMQTISMAVGINSGLDSLHLGKIESAIRKVGRFIATTQFEGIEIKPERK